LINLIESEERKSYQLIAENPAFHSKPSSYPTIINFNTNLNLKTHNSKQQLAKMCHKAACSTCSKLTWFGCGQHVPSVMDAIPTEGRCTCEPKVEKDGKEYPPKAKSG